MQVLDITALDRSVTYLVSLPAETPYEELYNLSMQFKKEGIHGVLVLGEAKIEDLVPIFKAASPEKREQILAALGYYFVDPISHEQSR